MLLLSWRIAYLCYAVWVYLLIVLVLTDLCGIVFVYLIVVADCGLEGLGLIVWFGVVCDC